MDQATRKTNRGLSPIWILPFVAFCIGIWLLFVSFRDAGIEIKIHFDTAEGITPGKTQVLYRGIPTGQVQDVFVDEDLKGVTLIVEMDKNARKALVDDTQFWIVRPEVAEGKVSGLGTILTGSYLSMRPGSSSRLSNNFIGLAESPPLSVTTPGLRIFLEAESLFSLQKGSNIYTKDVKIGQVVDYHLTDAGKVVLDAHIDPAFSHLINESTRFWNSSGISLDGDIRRGFNLQLESLAAMIYGGISCGTPKYSPATVPVTEGYVFQLHKNHNDAEVGTTVFLQLASGGGIIEGKTRVMYRGLKAGVVKKIEINHDDSHSVTAELQLDPRAEPILKKGTKFWVIRPLISLDGIHNLDTIISGCYITFEPGEGDFQDHFSVENGTIPRRAVSDGKIYKLESKEPASLEIGSPIFYNKIKVGETIDVSFSQDSNTIIFEVLVYEQYTHLIRSTTAFWNAGGFQAEARLSGVKVDFSSLKTVLTGGIAFENPAAKNEIPAEPAPEGTLFPLYQTYKDVVASVPEFKKQGLYLQLKAGRIRGLRPGSPVLFNNFKVGEIIDFSLDQVNTVMLVDILIHESYVSLVNSSSRFYNLSGLSVNIGLEGLELQTGSFESIAAGGIAFFTGEKNAQISEKDEFVLYENLTKARLADNIQILVRFTEPVEIKENTQIKYRGVAIGSLKNIRFGKGMSEVICDGYIQKDAAELFRETTRLLMIQPEITLQGVENLSTLISGSYLSVIPGEGELAKEFSALSVLPTGGEIVEGGVRLVLETPRLGSLKKNSPLYYRQILVGRVTGFELSPTTQEVWVHLQVDKRYRNLVHAGSIFWVASGISVTGGLFNEFKLTTESVESILSGGIAFATPEGPAMGELAGDGDHFFLYPDADEQWLNWRPVINLESTAGK